MNSSDDYQELSSSSSQYVRQHLSDLVRWRGWDAGREEASRTGMPLLVLVGFASCHWCHVLARETFRDPDAAELINRRFVPVVVDRQERPDLDRYYMSACQATGEGGGWPLLAAALADGRPFFLSTYRLLNGPEGMYETLLAIANLWEADRPTAEQP